MIDFSELGGFKGDISIPPISWNARIQEELDYQGLNFPINLNDQRFTKLTMESDLIQFILRSWDSNSLSSKMGRMGEMPSYRREFRAGYCHSEIKPIDFREIEDQKRFYHLFVVLEYSPATNYDSVQLILEVQLPILKKSGIRIEYMGYMVFPCDGLEEILASIEYQSRTRIDKPFSGGGMSGN